MCWTEALSRRRPAEAAILAPFRPKAKCLEARGHEVDVEEQGMDKQKTKREGAKTMKGMDSVEGGGAQGQASTRGPRQQLYLSLVDYGL